MFLKMRMFCPLMFLRVVMRVVQENFAIRAWDFGPLAQDPKLTTEQQDVHE